MKNYQIILLVSLILMIVGSIAMSANAQEENTGWRLYSQTLLTGETPLTKGMTSTSVFCKGKSCLVLDMNAELGEIMYLYSVTKWFSVGPSIGFFKNTPWVGPVAEIKLFNSHFKTLNWFGWSFGNPEEETTKLKPKSLFSYHQFSLVYNWVEGYYILQHYQENLPEHIVGTKVTFPIGENFSIFGGLGYMIRADKFLWSTGVTYNRKK
jgi:hypothetical protein